MGRGRSKVAMCPNRGNSYCWRQSLHHWHGVSTWTQLANGEARPELDLFFGQWYPPPGPPTHKHPLQALENQETAQRNCFIFWGYC